MLGEATDSVVSFIIRNHSVVISNPGVEVFSFMSVSAVGRSQDIFLVDDGTSAPKLALQVKSDWRMLTIKIFYFIDKVGVLT